jgi:hypothetical protein
MQNRTLALQALGLMLLGGVSTASAQSATKPVLTGIRLGSGYFINLNTSNNLTNWLSNDGASLIMQYPGGQAAFGAVFITVGQSIPPGNRPGQDLSAYQTLNLEMRGDPGTVVNVGIKDSTQADDGSETQIPIAVSAEYQTYSIPLSKFVGVNLKSVYVVTEWVFLGPAAQKLQVRTVAYSSVPPVTTMVLPHFVFGGGWYSALYFTNTSGSPVSFQVNFIADNGSPLLLPSVGGSSVTINLASRATSIVEAPNIGSLTDGYVSIALPIGVAGYGVFRQSAPGAPDQEAVVPLSGSSGTKSTLVWDETNFVTGVAIVNPSNVGATVSVIAYGSSGQMIGLSSVSLSAGNKTATVLKNLPGLSAIAATRGSADFVVSSGNVAVLGLRFNGGAFASIPTTSQ